LVLGYRRFGTAYQSYQQSSSPKTLLGYWTPEGGTGIFPRNIGNQHPTYATQHPRRAKIFNTEDVYGFINNKEKTNYSQISNFEQMDCKKSSEISARYRTASAFTFERVFKVAKCKFLNPNF
jgi:hypothetical protein